MEQMAEREELIQTDLRGAMLRREGLSACVTVPGKLLAREVLFSPGSSENLRFAWDSEADALGHLHPQKEVQFKSLLIKDKGTVRTVPWEEFAAEELAGFRLGWEPRVLALTTDELMAVDVKIREQIERGSENTEVLQELISQMIKKT